MQEQGRKYCPGDQSKLVRETKQCCTKGGLPIPPCLVGWPWPSFQVRTKFKHVRMARVSRSPRQITMQGMCNRVKDKGPVKSNSEAILMQFEDGKSCKHGIPLWRGLCRVGSWTVPVTFGRACVEIFNVCVWPFENTGSRAQHDCTPYFSGPSFVGTTQETNTLSCFLKNHFEERADLKQYRSACPTSKKIRDL